MLEIGDTIIANRTTGFPDYVTEGSEYEVQYVFTNVSGTQNFRIINDKGESCFPLLTRFTKRGER